MRPFELLGFLDAFDDWIARDSPSQVLRMTVLSWIVTRQDSPYEGVRRQDGLPNLWFGAVPATRHDDQQVVVCSYWIYEQAHTVQCDQIAVLGLPI